MFQGAFVVRSRGTAKSKGFSLTELTFSILLIAAIAVLSFPTVQGFTPVSDLQSRTANSSTVSHHVVPAGSGSSKIAPEGSLAMTDFERSVEGESALPATENRDDREQGGKAK